jgi:ankyrin repeat protein
LHSAIRVDDQASTRDLLDGGADPCEKDSMGRSALHTAACSDHIFAVDRLLSGDYPGILNAQDIRGQTALFFAVTKHRNAALVTRLLQQPGIKVNLKERSTSCGSGYGCTPLKAAIKRKWSKVIDLLRAAGGKESSDEEESSNESDY